MNIERSQLEELLESQVKSPDLEDPELRQRLKKNRDQYFRQAKYVELEVAEKRWRPDIADDYLYIRASHAVRAARKFILKDASIKDLLEPVRIDYRNKLREISSRYDN